MKMKNYSIIASVVFAFSVVNTLADDSYDQQDVCTVKSNFHKNLAGIATNDVGIQIINELRQTVHDICVDPKAHNGIVSLLDALFKMITDPNVSEIVGASLFWTRSFIKNKNFHDIWLEDLKGLNMWFDKEKVTSPLTDKFFKNLSDLLNDPLFDSTFERVIGNVGSMMNLGRNALFKTGAIISKPIRGKRNVKNNRR